MPPTILVVDDDKDIRRILVEALIEAGYAVEEASDGIVALQRIAVRVPDLILADMRMPHLDGIGLANLLAPHEPPIPFILMSANALPCDCSLPFIRKPFEFAALLTMMARSLPVSAVGSLALSGLGAT